LAKNISHVVFFLLQYALETSGLPKRRKKKFARSEKYSYLCFAKYVLL